MALVCVCAGCGTSRAPAPVEERTPAARAPAPVLNVPGVPGGAATTPPATPGTPAVQAPVDPLAKPGAENAGKPGFYTIKPGDTLIRIGLETGQNARDIARWNNIDNPNSLEVGQVIRVVPPGVDAAATAARGINNARVEARPLDAKPAPTAPASGTAPSGATPPPLPVPPAVGTLPPAGGVSPAGVTPPPPTAPSARDPDDELNWAWPAAGPVVGSFDEVRSKGLTISGKAGDPVLAAADGRVVYAGSGLRGYGNLVIVKHNNTYLTAYAHNQALLVKEDQVVRRGQKIAEMGSSDAERVQLHFEIRRQGKPIDPARLLPPR
ncbi:MAG TPA: peptidoglycan DD-metalloendopeptidase family protein [Burkholderiaceae bacterium]|nr:peptidoglycan DD-metalloendopeptidase family protein [Burkholderiaceae bacterium]